MATLNKVFLAGNLTRDPEVRYLSSGKAVADLGLAISRKFKTSTGEEKEETCFVNVVVWERQAETCGEYLKKGSPVLVEGSLQFEQWESNGEKKSRLRVRADRVQFLDRPPKRAEFSDTPEERKGPAARAPATAPEQQPPVAEEGGAADTDNLPF